MYLKYILYLANKGKVKIFMTFRKKEILKTKFICALYKEIIKSKLNEIEEKAQKICLKYFPKADKILVNQCMEFAYYLQCEYYSKLCFEECIKDYKE